MKFKVDIAEVTYSNDTVMTLMISEVERSPERTEDRAEESEKFRDLVRLLVEHEALDPNMAKMGAKKNKRNKTPLHYVVEFCSKKDVEALGKYFMMNFDVKTISVSSKNGNTISAFSKMQKWYNINSFPHF